MIAFIRPLQNHWKPSDFDLALAELHDPVRHIAQTVCLLESRCDDYAEYLAAIFQDRESRWKQGIHQWNFEECQHGELLRKLSEATDSQFQFDHLMEQYTLTVSYHAPTGVSVRGSVVAELVSRCVVEALASTLYRVLADTLEQDSVKSVFLALAQDEARHYGMFLRMLQAEADSMGGLGTLARCRHALKRMIALEDKQIMMASCIVAGRGKSNVRLRGESHWYLSRLYGLYRWKHLRYASRMLLQTVQIRPRKFFVWCATLLLWTGVKLRWIMAKVLVPNLISKHHQVIAKELPQTQQPSKP